MSDKAIEDLTGMLRDALEEITFLRGQLAEDGAQPIQCEDGGTTSGKGGFSSFDIRDLRADRDAARQKLADTEEQLETMASNLNNHFRRAEVAESKLAVTLASEDKWHTRADAERSLLSTLIDAVSTGASVTAKVAIDSIRKHRLYWND